MQIYRKNRYFAFCYHSPSSGESSQSCGTCSQLPPNAGKTAKTRDVRRKESAEKSGAVRTTRHVTKYWWWCSNGSDRRRNSTCSSGSSTRRFRVGRAADIAKIQYIYGPVGVTSRRRPTYVLIPYPSILLICMTSKQWSTKSDHSLCPRVLLLDEPLTVTAWAFLPLRHALFALVGAALLLFVRLLGVCCRLLCVCWAAGFRFGSASPLKEKLF